LQGFRSIRRSLNERYLQGLLPDGIGAQRPQKELPDRVGEQGCRHGDGECRRMACSSRPNA
jgi:hypothetical protein